MIKSELVQRVANYKPDLYQRDAERILDTILNEIVSAMARGNRVELRGFGAFSVRTREARTAQQRRCARAKRTATRTSSRLGGRCTAWARKKYFPPLVRILKQ